MQKMCIRDRPCAASAYNSAMNADIPTVYTAVSDPVVAGLAKEDGSSEMCIRDRCNTDSS